MFIDRVKIYVKGGDGGEGFVSFYRAKYITHGGPDGGDGGRGGDVILVADDSITTLMDFHYKRKFAAENGERGGKGNCSGKDGEDIVLKVPAGTVVYEEKTHKVMADMAYAGERKVLIKGGKGGRGNQHFATPTRQAPRFAEPGRRAREYDLILELKMIADVGIIGLPNAGKSTLLSMVTNAAPKIANYHFTTLTPNLGVVRYKNFMDFVMADIPGLVEGASRGVGLGHDFLRHIERTKCFVHVVDAAMTEGLDPVESVEKIINELREYNPKLLDRPMIIAANKTDIPEAEENVARLKEAYEPDYKVFAISAAANSGLDSLIDAVADILKDYPQDIVFDEEHIEYSETIQDDAPYTIVKENDVFCVEGVGILRMLGYTNIDDEKGFVFFQKYLRDKGIIGKLEEMGIVDGDMVKLYDLMFEYYQ